MYHWQRWWWGLIPLLLVYLLMLRWTAEPISNDIKNRISNIVSKDYAWATIKQDVRDIVVSGAALNPEDQKGVSNFIAKLWGVRVVSNNIAIAPEQKPYTFSIKKDESSVSLSGFVQNTQMKNTIVEKAKSLFAGLKINDSLSIARGGGDTSALLNKMSFALEQAKSLAKGEISLVDEALALSGKVADTAQFETLKSLLDKLPAGLKLSKNELTPNVVSPYTAQIKIENGQATLSGFVPNEALAKATSEKLATLGKIAGQFSVADGLPAGLSFENAIAHAASVLPNLKSGIWSLKDNEISLTGEVASAESFSKFNEALNKLPEGFKLASSKVDAPAQKPYKLSIQRDENGLTLSGFYPNSETLNTLKAALQNSFGNTKISNNLVAAGGEPGGFFDLAAKALVQLERLQSGEITLEDQNLTLKGKVYSESSIRDIPRALNAILPIGFTAQSDITLAQKQADVSNDTCQKLLSEALNGRTIQFQTGKADISEVSKGLLDELSNTAQRCGNANLEIIGHTDNIGTEDNNLVLSYNRAMTVVKYLVNSGVSIKRLAAIGYGSMKPVASNDTEQGKAKNRRIEFIVKP